MKGSDRQSRAEFLAGNLYLMQGNLAGAKAKYTEAIAISSTFAEAYVKRGIVYQIERQPSRAIAEYGQAIRIDSTCIAAYLNRSSALQSLGKYGAAIADCDTAISIGNPAETLYTCRGDAKLKSGDLDGASRDYSEAIQIAPDHAEAYCSRAAIYAKQGNYDAARCDLDMAVKIDPRCGKAFQQRGAVFIKLGEKTKAIGDFEKAISLGPEIATLHGCCGLASQLLHDHKRALRHFDRGIQLSPRIYWMYVQRGNARYHTFDLVGLHEDYRKAFDLRPTLSAALVIRHLQRAIDIDNEHAIVSCNEFLYIDSHDAVTYAKRGLTLLLLGRDKEAEPDFVVFRKLLPRGDAILGLLIDAAKRHLQRRVSKETACIFADDIPVVFNEEDDRHLPGVTFSGLPELPTETQAEIGAFDHAISEFNAADEFEIQEMPHS